MGLLVCRSWPSGRCWLAAAHGLVGLLQLPAEPLLACRRPRRGQFAAVGLGPGVGYTVCAHKTFRAIKHC